MLWELDMMHLPRGAFKALPLNSDLLVGIANGVIGSSGGSEPDTPEGAAAPEVCAGASSRSASEARTHGQSAESAAPPR